MAHHKRKRSKNQRAGCLLCKPWKSNGAKDPLKPRDRRERDRLDSQEKDLAGGVDRSDLD